MDRDVGSTAGPDRHPNHETQLDLEAGGNICWLAMGTHLS